jgi:hypothetical protein
VSFRPPRSKILHSMVITLLVLTCEVMPGLRPAGAAAIPTINPYHSAFFAKCSGNWDSDLPFDYSQLVAQQSLVTQLVSCEPDLSTDPLKIAAANEKTPVEEFDNQLYRIEDRSSDDYFKPNVLIQELDADRGYSGADSCIYLDRDNQMLRADVDTNCGIFERGFDYTQLFGVLTLSIIAILSFATVPLAWLLWRYYRARRLRGFTSAGMEASRSRVRRTRTGLSPVVSAPRQRLSSSRRRHRRGLRKRVRTDKGG